MKLRDLFNRRRGMLLTPMLAVLALVFSGGSASAVIGGTTIGGCIYEGNGVATYTLGPLGPIVSWETGYVGGTSTLPTPAVSGAQVMIQNSHSGGAHITYGTMMDANGLTADAGGTAPFNCWEAVIPDTKVTGTPDQQEVIAMITAPGYAVTSREFNWDPDGRYSKGADPVGVGAPPWNLPGTTMGTFTHPTGVHLDAGANCAGVECLSDWIIGPQDAYIMPYPQKTTSILHYVFYDNATNGNDNGPIIDPGINGVTVRVFDEHGNVVQTQVTGELAFSQGGFVTDDGVMIAGPQAYGYVYFQGLPGDDEYKIVSDPSTVTQADNPHFTLSLPDTDPLGGVQNCTGPDGLGYDLPTCNWWQTYTEERGHEGEAYAWPGSPGTMDGGYLTWHAFVEKIGNDVAPGGNPALNGSISGVLLDSTGADPGEATTIWSGGRVPPTNARFENGTAWNRTRSATGWGGIPDPGAPASDVIPNSRVMDGRVILFDLNGATARVVGTAVASNPTDFNDPGTGGEFTFTNVPAGTYGIYAMDRDLNYVMFVGTQVTVTPMANVSAGPILYERWGARSMGFVERNAGPALEGYTIKNWFKAGTTKGAVQTSTISAWFEQAFWPETGQMGFQFVDAVDGDNFRGKIVIEQYQDVPFNLGYDFGPVTYNWATHNSINRAVGYATHNYFVDLQIEDIPGTPGCVYDPVTLGCVGNIMGTVFNDHFSSSLGNRADGAYGEDEDRLWQGWTVELYNAPAPAALGLPATSCADLSLPLAPSSGQYCSAGLKTLTSEIGTFSCTLNSDCDTFDAITGFSNNDGKCAIVPNGLVNVKKTGKFTKSDNVTLGWNQPYTYPADEMGGLHASPVRILAGGPTLAPVIMPTGDYVGTAFPNIGTSASEAAAFIDSFNYAPMPGYYEFRDIAPGDYCVRTLPKNGYRNSPDIDVFPGGFNPVTATGGINSRVDLGVNTTPTQPAGLCDVPIAPVGTGSFYGSVSFWADGVTVLGYTGRVQDEDILYYDGTNFHMFFDGSAAGLLPNADINALHVVDSDTFYVSFQQEAGTMLPGLGMVQNEDIVLYDAGVWSMYFVGADHSLGDVAAEDIDSLSFLSDGRMVISTRGTANSPYGSNAMKLPVLSPSGWTGIWPNHPQDEDLLVFDPATGTFDMYFEGSDIALGPQNREDVFGASVGPNGDIYLTTYHKFDTLSGLTGFPGDIFVCRGAVTGQVSSCAGGETMDFAGLSHGFDILMKESWDAISILREGTCSNDPGIGAGGAASFSCTQDAQCFDVAHPFGLKMAGEIEGGMWDGMQATDNNPTSLLWLDAIALFGSPIAVKDGNDYFLGVGYQGDTRCHAFNNSLHLPGASMLPRLLTNGDLNPAFDEFSCRSTITLNQKPEFERRFAPGANRFIGNAEGFLWNRLDPSLPAGWYGQHENNPAYDSMELGIGIPQAGYKFEAAWTPLTVTTGGALNIPICAIGIATLAFTPQPWGAVTTINVSDGFSPIAMAQVSGTWSDGNAGSCVTGPNGQCGVINESAGGGTNSVSFSVDTIVSDALQPWFVYNANAGGVLNGACRVTGSTVYDPDNLPVAACADGLDNDLDGLVDMADPGCSSSADNDETDPVTQCNDGVDNDGDLLIDFPADPGCLNALDNNETDAPVVIAPACMDGLDNDGDGWVDWPGDPGCVDANDTDEFNPAPPVAQCLDGLDNDGDGFIDILGGTLPNGTEVARDPGCATITDNDETNPQCNDGLDNDGDGLIDFPADPGCSSLNDNIENDGSIHVNAMSGIWSFVENKLVADVTVGIVDNVFVSVDGATANFIYTWLSEGQLVSNLMSCVTDLTGICVATTGLMTDATTVDISLDSITYPLLSYEPVEDTVVTDIVLP